MVIIMSFVSGSFLSDFNIFVVLRSVATAVLIGSAQMVVLSIGQMNLSVGAIGGLAAITAGGIMDAFGLPVWLAIVGGLACGAACGASTASSWPGPASTPSSSPSPRPASSWA